MDSHHFTPVLCTRLTETLQLKVEREEMEQQFPRLDPTTLKEEDSEKPVTQVAHAEPARDGATGGLPLFEQIKEESCFLCTVETVKQEAATPEQAFGHKPLKSECLGIAASVKLEIGQNERGLSEDGRMDGKQASTQNHQRRPGETTPETSMFARPPPQNSKGRLLTRSRNQTENKSCSAPHNGGRKLKLRSTSCSRQAASGRPHLDKMAHSSNSNSTSHRFERKRHCVSRAASSPSSSSPPGSESGSEEQERDPTWAPHASHQAPRKSGAERGLQLRDMGAASRKTAENKGRSKLDRGRSGFPGPEPGARPGGGGGGSRRYVCSLCHKAFLTKRDLERHGRVHSGEKPFACARCGRRFNDVGNMRKHALVHSGERPHVCAECGKRFTESGNLKRHQRVHESAGTGSPRRFGCEACGRSYKEKGGLTRHQKARAWEGKGACVMRRWKEGTNGQ